MIILWLLKLGITMLIHNKDDIEFVTEFPFLFPCINFATSFFNYQPEKGKCINRSILLFKKLYKKEWKLFPTGLTVSKKPGLIWSKNEYLETGLTGSYCLNNKRYWGKWLIHFLWQLESPTSIKKGFTLKFFIKC